jgi:hypothetical protein
MAKGRGVMQLCKARKTLVSLTSSVIKDVGAGGWSVICWHSGVSILVLRYPQVGTLKSIILLTT